MWSLVCWIGVGITLLSFIIWVITTKTTDNVLLFIGLAFLWIVGGRMKK